ILSQRRRIAHRAKRSRTFQSHRHLSRKSAAQPSLHRTLLILPGSALPHPDPATIPIPNISNTGQHHPYPPTQRKGGRVNHNTRIYLSPPHMSGREQQYVIDAFESNWVAPAGPHITAFEEEICDFTGAPYAVALSSGTAALHLALLTAGV